MTGWEYVKIIYVNYGLIDEYASYLCSNHEHYLSSRENKT